MNFRSIGCIALLMCNPALYSQQQASAQTEALTRITGSNATGSRLPHIQMRDALYDLSRNGSPYFVVSFPTDQNASAIPNLIIKRSAPVDAKYASLIRSKIGKYLSGSFQLIEKGGESRGKNLNHYNLYPFRLNAQNEVEELLEYEVKWTTTDNGAQASRRSSAAFAHSSVLQSGTWYKIGVTQSGIHRLNRSFFSALGINASGIDPKNIRIYGNGGKMLPELNSAPRIDDLHENPILVVDGGDGSFDNADYVLFYATGPTEWKRASGTSKLKFQAVKNLYSDTSFYFVNVDLGEGLRIGVQPSGSGANASSSSYDYYNYHEEDLVSLSKSGRQQLGESFDFVNSYNFRWSEGDFIIGDSLMVECSVAAAAEKVNTQFVVSGNGMNLSVDAPYLLGGEHDDWARQALESQAVLNTASAEISLTVQKTTPRNAGWLDKLTVNARRGLSVSGRQVHFRDTRVAAPGKVTQYIVGAAIPQGLQLWNVTDPVNPFIQAYDIQSNGLSFVAGSDVLNEYCASPTTDYYTPTIIGKVANQNLHAIMQADYVIVTHPLFLKEAQRLGAFHQQQEGYTYCVASTEQIYNEFSSGRPDLSAIRDFIRMVYSRNISTGKQVRFACLMGDGSYNNRSRNLVNNSNLIPTYQSVESFDPLFSVATDDFFAMMGDTEGPNADVAGSVDIGMGRFTCRTVNEVRAILDKVEHYYSKEPNFKVEQSVPISYNSSQSPLGDWRTWLLFLGDDLDGALHMEQSDTLARIVKQIAPTYNNDKIMLDAYQRFSTPGGNRYPDASGDFLRRLKKGALVFNYTGHGGEVGLTAERMVDIGMINSLDNFNQLPLFITATCEFSRYDDPNRTSAGELCLLNPKGGAVALMTTCRLAFSLSNEVLNKRLLKTIFAKLPNGQWPALGDIMRITKVAMGSQQNFANFHLLGDPALRLAYPELNVATTRINNVTVNTTSSDTLKALARVTVEGMVTDAAGNKLDFNGVVYPTVFDKEQNSMGLVNDRESAANYYHDCDTCSTPFVFQQQKNLLYRGKAVVSHGDFNFTFLVPKDISFAPGRGKITYYATNGQTDASGHYTNVIVGGASENVLNDPNGPEIDLFLNDKNFVNGGLTDENPILYADLIDSSGINTSGIGLGHDISVVLDANTDKPVILNDYYEANLNSYQSGRVRYPFSKLTEGSHQLSFKVWDIQNNSSVVALDFIVAERAELALKQVLNYPNPFTSRTKFFFEHNQSGVPLRVHIQVFTVSGKVVKTIQQTVVSESFISSGIEWDGRDDYGDKLARGVYIYKLAILDINNKKAEKIEKLVILN